MAKQAVPELECDLVLAGGVTSGVVFPRAVLELKDKYRFRSIGGTSAGAIAASIVAAAEYGRRNGAADSFAPVAAMPEFLENRLASLFQPKKGMGALFGVAKILVSIGVPSRKGRFAAALAAAWAALRALWEAMALYPMHGAAGLLISAVLFVPYLSSLFRPGVPLVLSAALWLLVPFSLIALLLLGIAAAIGAGIVRDVLKLKRNNFGICPGLSQPGMGEGLINWVDRMIEAAAKRMPAAGVRLDPLTFGDLTGGEAAASVNLRMMTTNITFGIGQALPDLGATPLYFEESELKQVLPENAVDYMMRLDERRNMSTEDGKPLYRFPAGPLLPVIAAVRMSLSFPVLFTAFPLYAVIRAPKSGTGGTQHKLERVLYSDGGITSNFPIRFFDSLLPTRPTFGLSLDDRGGDPGHIEVYMPMDAGSGLQFQPRAIGGLASFIFGIINTAREWQDRQQGRMSGNRERIAHVYLTQEQGGLHLEMPPSQIKTIGDYGARAGKLMAGSAAPDGADFDNFDFADHQWRRFLNSYACTEHMLENMHKSWTGAEGRPNVRQAIAALKASPPSYHNSKAAWRDHVFARMDALMRHFSDVHLKGKDKAFGPKGPLRNERPGVPALNGKLQIVPDD